MTLRFSIAAPAAVRALEQQVADLQRLVGKKEEQIEFLIERPAGRNHRASPKPLRPNAGVSPRKKDVRCWIGRAAPATTGRPRRTMALKERRPPPPAGADPSP
ncbi:hypothetical protein HZB60_12515 [candidate division KSB1 bacterium]|nr:hypothetical protein [candidate division KSB1 bacterium]